MKSVTAAAVAAVVGLAWAGVLRGEDWVPAEQWLPQSYWLVVEVPSLAQARKSFQTTALHDIWTEPDVQAAVKGLRDAVGDKLPPEGFVKKHLGVELRDVTSLFAGQVCLALGMSPESLEKEIPMFVLVADLGENVARFKEVVGTVVGRIREQADVEHHVEKVNGREFYTLGPAGDDPLVYTFVGRALLASWSRPALERLAPRVGKRQPDSLAQGAMWRQVVAQDRDTVPFLRSCFDVTKIFDFLKTLTTAEQMGEYDRQDVEKALRVMDAIGLRGLRFFVSSLSARGKGLENRGALAFSAPRKGVLKAVLPKRVPDATLAFVPQNVNSVVAGTIDLSVAWDSVMAGLRTASEGTVAYNPLMSGLRGFEQQLQLSIRNDLLGALGPTFSVFVQPGGGRLLGGLTGLVIVAECPAPQKLDAVIQKLCSLGAGHFQLQTIPGEVPVRYLQFGQQMPIGITPSYAIANGHVVIGLMSQTVRSILARVKAGGPSVLGNPAFQQAMAGMPAERLSLQFCDTKSSLPAMYNGLLPLVLEIRRATGIRINTALLPPSEVIARHLFPAGAVTYEEDGMLKWRDYSPAGPLSYLSTGQGSGTAGMLTGMLSLSRLRASTLKMKCRSNLRQIGIAGVQYLDQKGDQKWFPRKLEDLVTAKIIREPTVFICPCTDDKPQPGKFVCSYESAFDRLGVRTDDSVPGDLLHTWDKLGNHDAGRHVCFMDGHVEFLTEAQFQEALKRLDEYGAKLKQERGVK